MMDSLSNFTLNFNLRCYIEALSAVMKANPDDPEIKKEGMVKIQEIWAKHDANPVGRCRLTLSNPS
jgi:hypothetical protein